MGKAHSRSRVFTSGIALINFLHCVYQPAPVRKEKKKEKKTKSEGSEKGEVVPSELKLFFDPKDRS